MKLFRCKKGEKEVNNQRSNKLSKQPTGRKAEFNLQMQQNSD